MKHTGHTKKKERKKEKERKDPSSRELGNVRGVGNRICQSKSGASMQQTTAQLDSE